MHGSCRQDPEEFPEAGLAGANDPPAFSKKSDSVRSLLLFVERHSTLTDHAPERSSVPLAARRSNFNRKH